MLQRLFTAALLALLAPVLHAQAPTFDAASIRPNTSATINPILRPTQDGIRATDVSLHELICGAYHACAFPGLDLVNLPAWASLQRFDLNAKVSPAEADALSKLTPDERHAELDQRLQTLLIDRFHLSTHTEPRQLPAYRLVRARSSAKLQPSHTPTPDLPNGLLRLTPGHITAQNLPITRLAQILTPQLGRAVADATGLTGRYDFTLDWPVPEITDPLASTSALITAIEEQLGLKLESTRIPVRVFVIDQLDHPTEN